ncbi:MULTISPECIES: hypothetical protein [Hyphomicrobium]|uniref:Outer membrane lipoprotein carrier protein LolA n=1 Tax=Hyphomicrobium sulfonivorans TaxID=121290 RepID=A0A109BAJ2_HYPSL|nr:MULTISPECIES: hypothetical protein [Hyphomicrobium]KWT65231.1 hypothetical protein APY04_2980 [Hyphomicrobium sulfonivorans]MBI1649204.1 hypothetical protein [Hyphomicrobium sulfonivorans]MDH4981972.1 hypothetical protein [Hyphomicrobium sp. D-2]NSL70265.1 hypothetical protein [Hyphomicrobium sulfonivorans]
MRTTLAVVTLLVGATAAAADCTKEVNDAFAKLRESSAFRMQTKITNAQGSLTMSNDYVLPDRMHQTVSMEKGPGNMEMILVGDKAWSKQENTGWAEMPPNFASSIAKQMKETVAEPPKDVQAYECLGDVEFEGKTYKGFKAKLAAKEGAQAPGEANVQTVYVDKDLGIPVRNIVTSEKEPDKLLFDGKFELRDGLKIEPPKVSDAP